jgi:hypothetical protein
MDLRAWFRKTEIAPTALVFRRKGAYARTEPAVSKLINQNNLHKCAQKRGASAQIRREGFYQNRMSTPAVLRDGKSFRLYKRRFCGGSALFGQAVCILYELAVLDRRPSPDNGCR